MQKKLLSILWILLLAAGLIIPVCLPDRAYSTNEKRKLATLPEFTPKDFISGEYTSKLSTYLEDQFAWRDGWVSLKTSSDYLMGKRDSNGVYFGKDGYLIEMHESLNTRQGEKNLASLVELKAHLDAKEIPMWCMAAPTASHVLKDKLPAYAGNSLQTEWVKALKEAGLSVIDLENELLSHANEYIYYRTDHHWTSLGSYYAYSSWCKAHNKAVAPLSSWTCEVLSENFLGTTYAKVNKRKSSADTITAYYKTLVHHTSYNNDNYITDTIYERKYLEGTDHYAVFFNSNQATCVVSGEGSGKLLIIKDSYANSFAQFIIDDYEETHMLDLRFFKGKVSDYIETNGITEVLVLYNIPNMMDDSKLQYVSR